MSQHAQTNNISELKINNGIEQSSRQALANELSLVLADTYVLMMETQNVHWNAKGPIFHAVHNLTEEQYEDMFQAIDLIAERILMLGYSAPAGLPTYSKMTRLKFDEPGDTATELVSRLVEANDKIAATLRSAVELAEKDNDPATADMLTARIIQHEQYAWMLRAQIAQETMQ